MTSEAFAFKTGDRVRHINLGYGVVVYDKGGDHVRVRLDASRRTTKPIERSVQRDRIRLVGAQGSRAALALASAPSYERPEHAPQPKDLPVRHERYLAFVRSKPCCFCFAPAPSDPHHFGPRGMGTKTDDLRVVPLCRRCHDQWHSLAQVLPKSHAETVERFYSKQVDLLVEFFGKAPA